MSKPFVFQNPLRNEPVAVSAATVAVLNVLAMLNVVTLGADQVSAINVAVALVLGLIVRSRVSPTEQP